MDNVVITRLKGGLGNQMFQYALGRHLALKKNSPLLLDLSFFDLPAGPHTSREFELDVFDLEYTRASPEQLKSFRCFEKGGVVAAIERTLKRSTGYEFINDRSRGFQPEVLNGKGRIFLNGYWQSEKYFAPIEDDIRRTFSFKGELDGRDRDLAEQMRSINSISIHVRRGDYVHSSANSFYANCGPEYYRAGVKRIAASHPDPHLFLFSDDIAWVQENMRFDHPMTFVDHDPASHSGADMRSMSLCRHNIIANSSFSWWAAWLNKNPEKLVIAPKHWFTSPELSDKDMIPERWIRL